MDVVIVNHIVEFTLTGFLVFLTGYIKVLYKKNAASAMGVQALLRDRILQACKYWISHGHCPANERVSVEKMYNAYANLGGNDVAHDAYTEFRKLPLFPPEKEET